MLLGPLWIIHMEEDGQGIRLVWIFYIEIFMFNSNIEIWVIGAPTQALQIIFEMSCPECCVP